MKVTVFFVIIFVITFSFCSLPDTANDELIFQQKVDSIASVQIDSAYAALKLHCDSMLQYQVPFLVDSILKADTNILNNVALTP